MQHFIDKAKIKFAEFTKRNVRAYSRYNMYSTNYACYLQIWSEIMYEKFASLFLFEF